MVIDRRSVLLSLLTGAFAPCLAAAGERELFVSCRLDGQGNAAVSCFDGGGVEVFASGLPSRGHDTVQRPRTRDFAVFARRPGNWLLVIDGDTGHIHHSLAPITGRTFCGHGAYSADGKLLYASEVDIATSGGIIGIYDATARYARLGEYPSGGIGPHDLMVTDNGAQLIVANGGLRTDVSSGRDILVTGDAAPNLVRIDPRDGSLIERIALPSHLSRLSIRHLAARQDGTIAFGCQHQGDADDLPPLVGLVTSRGRPVFLDCPEIDLARMKNYVGSLTFNADGSLLAASSPHGNQVMVWSMAQGRHVSSIAKSDVCGLAAARNGFLASSGNSGIETLGDARTPVLLGFIWDNHLLRLVPA